jgi:hypothetical protein
LLCHSPREACGVLGKHCGRHRMDIEEVTQQSG